MTAFLAIFSGVLQLVLLVLQNKFEHDSAERKRKDDLHVQLAAAIKAGNLDNINDLLNQLRV